jgi:hypothetical protein
LICYLYFSICLASFYLFRFFKIPFLQRAKGDFFGSLEMLLGALRLNLHPITRYDIKRSW